VVEAEGERTDATTVVHRMNDVLLVEDDDDVRFVLRMVLEDEGYTVREAKSGETALEQFRLIAGDLGGAAAAEVAD